MSQLQRLNLKTPVLKRVEAMASQCAGTSLVLLARAGDEVHRLSFGGESAALPSFCALMRSAEGGCNRCLTCRRLIILSVQFRGLSDYACHGGIQIVAAPVNTAGASIAPLAIASAAFAHANREEGWRAVRAQTTGAKLNLARLREAYYALPVLSDDIRKLLRSLVDLAAAAVAEHLPRERQDGSADPFDDARPTLQRDLETALSLSRDAAFEAPGCARGATLARLVTGMVIRDPALPFTVGNVARAAGMTPNHFSTLFRKHTGKTFMDFLTAERIERAKHLLTDPTLSVHQVSESAGFQDTAYFSRRFKQCVGKSPTAWREGYGAATLAPPVP